MANIQVSALLSVGYDLFNDDTSFIDELATEEVQNVVGGGYYGCHSHHNHHYSHGYSHGSYDGYSRGYGYW